jgi:hypothetical protein
MEPREPMVWKHWPVSPSVVQKGDDFDPMEMGLIASRKDKALALLRAKDDIDGWISTGLGGKKWSVCIRGDLIHINTDSEAITYHDRQAEAGIAKLARNARALVERIDHGALDSDDRERLHRTRAIRAMQAQAARSARVTQGE